MGVRKSEVKTYNVSYRCDEIDCIGEVKYTGHVNMSNPPQYIHKCQHCEKQYKFGVVYPGMVYEEDYPE